jgi:hypothetical protein
MIGEFIVRLFIGKSKPIHNKYVINDLTFHDGTKSVQIDHILLNEKGIHVIETKNYAGRIYGSETDHEWTQVLAYGKVKNKFHSPIKQNAGHLYSLKRVVGDQTPMFSYVVFTGRAELKIKSKTIPVIYPMAFRRAMKKMTKNSISIPIDQLKTLNDQLLKLKNENTITRKQHVKSINERIEKRKNN